MPHCLVSHKSIQKPIAHMFDIHTGREPGICVLFLVPLWRSPDRLSRQDFGDDLAVLQDEDAVDEGVMKAVVERCDIVPGGVGLYGLGSNTVMSASMPTCRRPLVLNWGMCGPSALAGTMVELAIACIRVSAPCSRTHFPRMIAWVLVVRGWPPASFGKGQTSTPDPRPSLSAPLGLPFHAMAVPSAAGMVSGKVTAARIAARPLGVLSSMYSICTNSPGCSFWYFWKSALSLKV
jgi:hypothetical protein